MTAIDRLMALNLALKSSLGVVPVDMLIRRLANDHIPAPVDGFINIVLILHAPYRPLKMRFSPLATVNQRAI